MNNTIILKKSERRLTELEFKKFNKGDLIWGEDSNPEEIKRWNIDQREEAEQELKKYNCSYKKDIELYNITEYALEICKCDELGEFIEGSDFILAEELKIKY